jgi:hypothetical protein
MCSLVGSTARKKFERGVHGGFRRVAGGARGSKRLPGRHRSLIPASADERGAAQGDAAAFVRLGAPSRRFVAQGR